MNALGKNVLGAIYPSSLEMLCLFRVLGVLSVKASFYRARRLRAKNKASPATPRARSVNLAFPRNLGIHLKQQGAVMFMTLILLLALTVLAVSLVAVNSDQTHLAANATDSANSFEKTEAALNIGINSLLNGLYLPSDFQNNVTGLYQLDTSSPPLWTTINWSNSAAVINSFQGASGAQASYIIEQLPSVIQPGQSMSTPTRIYRITARSIGDSGNTSVILQTTTQTQD